MTYTIVSHHEMDLDHGKLSCNSPIGLALMGRKVGETVDVDAPAGLLKLSFAIIKNDTFFDENHISSLAN